MGQGAWYKVRCFGIKLEDSMAEYARDTTTSLVHWVTDSGLCYPGWRGNFSVGFIYTG